MVGEENSLDNLTFLIEFKILVIILGELAKANTIS